MAGGLYTEERLSTRTHNHKQGGEIDACMHLSLLLLIKRKDFLICVSNVERQEAGDVSFAIH